MTAECAVGAAFLVPVQPEGVVHKAWGVRVANGRIVTIGPWREVSKDLDSNQCQYFEQAVLLPGLINAHTHVAMNLMRGIADDLPLTAWLQEHIWPAEMRVMSSDFVYHGSRHAIAEMIRGGVTCFNDSYFFPDAVAKAAKEAGMRCVAGFPMIDFPTPWAETVAEYLAKADTLIAQADDDPLVSYAWAPHAPYTVGDEAMLAVLKHAEQHDLKIHIHVHETEGEVTPENCADGERPLARMHRLGVVTPRLIAVHMTQLTDNEIQLCAEQKASVVHCPESNLKLASGIAPVADLDRAGVNVALGTDGAASNNDLDMFGEMRTAALLAKGVSGDASVIPAPRALSMATINGAKALGLEEQCGSLEIGKWADMIAVQLGSIDMQPCFDVISQLVYAGSRRDVSDVWIAGQQVLQQGRWTSLDEQAILRESNHWYEKLCESA